MGPQLASAHFKRIVKTLRVAIIERFGWVGELAKHSLSPPADSGVGGFQIITI